MKTIVPLLRWPLVIPIGMIAVGVLLLFTYTRDLAKEHKTTGEKWGVSRGISEGFHLFLARFFASIAIVVGVLMLVRQLV